MADIPGASGQERNSACARSITAAGRAAGPGEKLWQAMLEPDGAVSRVATQRRLIGADGKCSTVSEPEGGEAPDGISIEDGRRARTVTNLLRVDSAPHLGPTPFAYSWTVKALRRDSGPGYVLQQMWRLGGSPREELRLARTRGASIKEQSAEVIIVDDLLRESGGGGVRARVQLQGWRHVCGNAREGAVWCAAPAGALNSSRSASTGLMQHEMLLSMHLVVSHYLAHLLKITSNRSLNFNVRI
eukprot:2548255-Pleurochrysis_carterae.AAC.1